MQDFSPVSSNKLYVQIYNQIRAAITSGTYRVGDKLPSEKELCSQFNVSRVPVREALCALELTGLVESSQGVGVYVRNTGAAAEEWMQEVEPQDIIQARAALEPSVAREAAKNISAEEKLCMERIIRQFRAEKEAGIHANETDMAFHKCIARASGNYMYTLMYDTIFKAMKQKMWELILSRTISTAKYRDKNYEEHAQIADAILTGDPEAAYSLMKAHMDNLYLRYWN